MEKWQLAAEAAFVIPCCVRDLFRKSIPFWYFASGGAAAVLLCILMPPGQEEVPEIALSVLPGAFLLLVCFATGEKIGAGDGIFFVLLGLMVRDAEKMLVLLCLSLLFSSAVSAVLLGMGRVRRSTKLPFLPFAGIAAAVLGRIFHRGDLPSFPHCDSDPSLPPVRDVLSLRPVPVGGGALRALL